VTEPEQPQQPRVIGAKSIPARIALPKCSTHDGRAPCAAFQCRVKDSYGRIINRQILICEACLNLGLEALGTERKAALKKATT